MPADYQFIGEIFMNPYNFAPRGYARCDGQLLPIAQNTALFSLLGTNFGGNGVTTFGLPDLRGRVPVHNGQSPGMSSYTLGQSGGNENITLTSSNLPPHVHPVSLTVNATATNEPGDVSNPSGAYLANTGALDKEYKTTPTPANVVNLPAGTASGTTGITGSGSPFSNLQPYLVLQFIIALQGFFPSRN